MFGITYNCQLKCPHCCVGNYENEPPRELTNKEIKDVLDQSNKAFVINFFGGEPTMREDLMDLIKYASERSIYVFCDTNGIKITKDYAKQLKESGLEILYVSIDSPHPKEHDRLRGMKGLFEKATQGIKNALEAGLKCELSTYITKENLANGDFESVIQLARDLGATGVRYLLPTPTGRWLDNPEVMLTPEEEKKVRKIAKFPYVCRDFYFQNQTSSQCRGMSDHAYFYISPYGDVMPCCFIPLTFGNVREEPLKTILERMWGHQMFCEDWVDKECPMLNKGYRERYIDSIPPKTKLPFRIC
jgi:MoaA/NifB/PqqE/SkfB family radical SAM enzyme